MKTNLNQDNIYFTMHCMYNAKTEMYDRTLTDMRDRYDPTSVYIGCSKEVRSTSNTYANFLYWWCRRKIEYVTKRPFDINLWRESIKEYIGLSAQGWIDLYEHLAKNGEVG